MSGFYRVVIFVLCMFSMGWGIPAFAPGDLDRDGGFDLQDVMLSVRCIAQSDDASDFVFSREFTSLVRAIRAAAGLDVSIANASTLSVNACQFTVGDMPVVSSLIAPHYFTESVPNFSNVFSSINNEPPKPPPKNKDMSLCLREVFG